jgi:hypothetical protein
MRHLLILLFLASATLACATSAAAEPRLTLAAYQVTPGTAVVIRAAGFTPSGIVISHLIRPDGSEYPTMTFEADGKGEFSHTITIVPTMIGTYEVRMTDRDSKASTTTRFLMAATGTPGLPESQSDLTPAAYVGVWQGIVAQRTPGSESSAVQRVAVQLALSGGRAGAVVGTVAYPSLLCGGELWLLGVGADLIQLGEIITYGEERCAGRGVITVRTAPDGTLGFAWRDALRPGPYVAAGTLARR